MAHGYRLSQQVGLGKSRYRIGPIPKPNTRVCTCGFSYQHILADIVELLLDLDAVFTSHLLFLLVPGVGLALDAGDDAPGRTAGPHLRTETTSH